MDSVVRKSGMPVATVTVGSVTISIYAAPVIVRSAKPAAADSGNTGSVPESKVYQSFQVAHYEGNRRILQRRNTLDKAKALAKEIASRLNRDGSRAQYFTEKDRRIYILAQVKASHLAWKWTRFAGSMANSSSGSKPAHWRKRWIFSTPTASASGTVPRVEAIYAEYLAHLMKRGVGNYHMRDVNRYIGNFADAFPGLISAIETPRH